MRSPHRRVLHGRPAAVSTHGETTARHVLLASPSAELRVKTPVRQSPRVRQVDSTHAGDPSISKETYDVAIGLIQSFDEMEGEDFRWARRITLELLHISVQSRNNCFGLVLAAEPTETTARASPSAAASSFSSLVSTRFASCRRLCPSSLTGGESVFFFFFLVIFF